MPQPDDQLTGRWWWHAPRSRRLGARHCLGTTPRRRSRARHVLLIATALLGVVAVLALLQLPIGSTLSHTVSGLDVRWIGVALLCEVASMSMFARLQRGVLTSAGLRLPLLSSLAIVYAGNAVAVTVPVAGGGASAAFTYRQYVQRGATGSMATWAMGIAGVISTATFALLVAVGTMLEGDATTALIGLVGTVAVLIPVIALVVALHHPRARRRLSAPVARIYSAVLRLRRRSRADATSSIEQGLERLAAITMSRPQTARAVVLATMNWVFDALCLWAVLQAVGAQLPLRHLVLVYAAAVAAASIGFTPAGVGTVEAAIALALTRFGTSGTVALPSAILYRAISSWLVLLVGWCVFAVLRRRSHEPSALETSLLDDESPGHVARGFGREQQPDVADRSAA